MKIKHVAGPTLPYPLEGLMFYHQRCERCGALLDLGRINPLLRFTEGESVIREEQKNGDLVLHAIYAYVQIKREGRTFEPVTICEPTLPMLPIGGLGV